MRPSLLSSVLPSLLCLPLAAQGLTPVAPRQEPPALPDAFAREFRREEWRAALEQPDLAQREQAYDALLTRARLDPLARAFVEELAADPAGGELAWTARLALRELGRAPSFPSTTLFGNDPLLRSGLLDGRMQELLEGLQQQRLRLGVPGARGLAGATGRNVRVQQDPHGAKVEIIEDVGGEEQRRTYEGGSLEEILAQHPELEKELGGLSLRLPPGQSIDLGLGLPQGTRPGGRGEARTFATPLGPVERGAVPLATDKLGVIVQPVTAEHARELGLDEGVGLYVERSQPGSFADLLGVSGGEVLLELDGKALAKAEDIEQAMKARKRDADLSLVYLDAEGKRQEKTWKKPAR